MDKWMRTILMAVVVMAACADEPTGVARVDRVEMDPEAPVVVVGDSIEMTAVPLTQDGAIVVGAVLWRALQPTVATARVSGVTAVVKAVSPGVARIEAESGGVTAYVDVTVIAAPQVATVTVLPQTLVLEPGQEATLQAVARTANDEAIEGLPAEWSVEGDGLALTEEPSDGFATFVAETEGEYIVRATIDGVTGEAEVQVVVATPPPVAVAGVVIAPANFSLPVNHETSLQAIVTDAAGNVLSGRTIAWSSSNEAVAAVTPIGISSFANLVARSAGTTIIRAVVEGVQTEMTLTVTAAPPPDAVLYLFFSPLRRGIWTNQVIDAAAQLTAHGTQGPIAEFDVTWSVENPAIASVDASGNVRGLAKGTTKVYATHGEVQAYTLISVFEPAQDSVVFDLTYDWWDGQWHMAPVVGVEQWTDGAGTTHEVGVYPTAGELMMTDDGKFRREITYQGWAYVDGAAALVVNRTVVQEGAYTIRVGGATGYDFHPETGASWGAHGADNAGHMIMLAALGDEPVHSYMLRMRQ